MNNIYRQSNYYMPFTPSKITKFDECLVKSFKMLVNLKTAEIEYKFLQY